MPINFPNNPSNNDTTTLGGITYTYDSAATTWTANAPISTGLDSSETISLVDSDYVQARQSAGGVTVYSTMQQLIAATGMSNGDQALVTANNNLYIYSGSGWYKIATVQNDSPSAITGVDSNYTLAIDGTATTITAVSTDPEGFPLTLSLIHI